MKLESNLLGILAGLEGFHATKEAIGVGGTRRGSGSGGSSRQGRDEKDGCGPKKRIFQRATLSLSTTGTGHNLGRKSAGEENRAPGWKGFTGK